jgi:RNA polymerase-binding transcription factor DksA
MTLAYYQSNNGGFGGILFLVGIFVFFGIWNAISKYFKKNRENREGHQRYRDYYYKEKNEHELSRKASSLKISELEKQNADLERDLKSTNNFVDETLLDWKKWGAMLPSLRTWADRVREEYDAKLERRLRNKSHPALRAADEVKKALAKARESKKNPRD